MQPEVPHKAFDNTQVSRVCLGHICATVQTDDVAPVLRFAAHREKVKAVNILVLTVEALAKLVCIDGPATSCRVLEHSRDKSVRYHFYRIFLFVNGPDMNRAVAFAFVSHSNRTLFRVFASILGTKYFATVSGLSASMLNIF